MFVVVKVFILGIGWGVHLAILSRYNVRDP